MVMTLSPQQLELAFISAHLDPERVQLALARGVREDAFQVEQYARAWELVTQRLTQGKRVSAGDIKAAFDVDVLPDVTDPDLFLDELLRRTHARRARMAILEHADLLQRDPQAAVAQLIARLSAVSEVAMAHTRDVSTAYAERLTRLRDRQAQVARGEQVGLPTGLPFMDEVGDRFRPGDLVGILGMPNVGKSWLLEYFCAYANWFGGASVLFLSPESTIEDIEDRLDPIYARFMGLVLSNTQLRNGTFDVEAVESYLEQRALVALPKFIIRDAGERGVFTLTDIVAQVREHRPALLAIDGFHLVELERGAKSWEAMQVAARTLKGLGQELGMVVLAGSQMQRSVVQANDDPPGLGFSAYGMALEETANRIIQLAERRGQPCQRVLKMPKVRDGQRTLVRRYLRFDVDSGSIGELVALPDATTGEVDFT